MRDVSVPKIWDRKGLPGWAYHSPKLLELEKELVFLSSWQLICHISDVKNKGDFLTFDFCNERILILKDDKNNIQAYNNLCRHRGSRVVAETKGNCKALVCPFHGWVYNLDGTLRGVAKPNLFPKINKQNFGLKKIEFEIWNGFIFIRLNKGSQPSIKELMSPFEEELSNYKIENMIPTEGFWTENSPVNWKSIRDVDNEGYHVPMAHPGLQDLYGFSYFDEPYVDGLSKSEGVINKTGGRSWSVRNYKKFSNPHKHLSTKLQNKWNYYGVFPNFVIATTPEIVQFYQEFPISVNKSLLRGAIYRHKEETRSQKVARYLAYRIDQDTIAEDIQLTMWSNEAMASKSFEGFYLSDQEYGIKTHHDHLRKILPILNLEKEPKEDEIEYLNKKYFLKEVS